MRLTNQYLINSSDLTLDDIQNIFQKADYFGDAPSGEIFDDLRNFTVCTMFFEPSTRTKISFEIAARRLSAISIDFDLSSTSYLKGESLLDTIHTLEAMGVNFFISRNSDIGSARYFVENSNSKIINAGEGTLDHPTQGLLDAYTLYKEFGGLESLKGKRICLVGDIRHSRVARSNFEIMSLLGLEISTCSPEDFQALDFKQKNYSMIDEAIAENDIIMMLRIQKERLRTNEKFDFNNPMNLKWYRDNYALTTSRAKDASNLLFMHPGPANFGVELDKSAESLPNSLIRKQVRNGVMIRMAILSLLASS